MEVDRKEVDWKGLQKPEDEQIFFADHVVMSPLFLLKCSCDAPVSLRTSTRWRPHRSLAQGCESTELLLLPGRLPELTRMQSELGGKTCQAATPETLLFFGWSPRLISHRTLSALSGSERTVTSDSALRSEGRAKRTGTCTRASRVRGTDQLTCTAMSMPWYLGRN